MLLNNEKNTSHERIISGDNVISIKEQNTFTNYYNTDFPELEKFVTDNFQFIEVKTSTSRNFSQKSKAQKHLEYYDLLIGFKLQKKYHDGFIGDLSRENYLEFINLLNVNDVCQNKTQSVYKLNETNYEIPILELDDKRGARH